MQWQQRVEAWWPWLSSSSQRAGLWVATLAKYSTAAPSPCRCPPPCDRPTGRGLHLAQQRPQSWSQEPGARRTKVRRPRLSSCSILPAFRKWSSASAQPPAHQPGPFAQPPCQHTGDRQPCLVLGPWGLLMASMASPNTQRAAAMTSVPFAFDLLPRRPRWAVVNECLVAFTVT